MSIILQSPSSLRSLLPSASATNIPARSKILQLHQRLDGYTGICHGGFLSATLDHTMAILARAYPGGKDAYTKNLQINFQNHCLPRELYFVALG